MMKAPPQHDDTMVDDREPYLTDAYEPDALDAFRIRTTEDANAYLRRRYLLEQERDLLKAQMTAMIRRVESDMQRLDFQQRSSFEEWTRRELEGLGRKSLELAYGRVGLRHQPRKVVFTDMNEAFVAAKVHGMEKCFQTEFVPSAYLKIANARLEETGEMLPGTSVVSERDVFTLYKAKGETQGKDEE